jgi:hypothetical protein
MVYMSMIIFILISILFQSTILKKNFDVHFKYISFYSWQLLFEFYFFVYGEVKLIIDVIIFFIIERWNY